MFREIGANWSSLSKIDWRSNSGILSIHVIGMIVMQCLMGLGWHFILQSHHTNLDRNSLIYSFYVPSLGKYMPGKVLFLAGRVEFTHRFGASRAVGLSTFILENVFHIFATAFFILPCLIATVKMSISLQTTGYVVLFIIATVIALKPAMFFGQINRLLKLIKRDPLTITVSSADFLKILFNYLAIWWVYGASCALLAIAIGGVSADHFFTIVSAFVAAWLIGFLSILTPGGLGVREGILVLLLQPVMDSSHAMLLAIVTRLTWTLMELGFSGIALLLPVNFKK
jgi:uncharacterized membrane protein YbhN (UPF0104 family)